jgi:hypothetical protein
MSPYYQFKGGPANFSMLFFSQLQWNHGNQVRIFLLLCGAHLSVKQTIHHVADKDQACGTHSTSTTSTSTPRRCRRGTPRKWTTRSTCSHASCCPTRLPMPRTRCIGTVSPHVLPSLWWAAAVYTVAREFGRFIDVATVLVHHYGIREQLKTDACLTLEMGAEAVSDGSDGATRLGAEGDYASTTNSAAVDAVLTPMSMGLRPRDRISVIWPRR